MATNIQQFEQMLGQLLSIDNNLRGQAEHALNETKKSPEFCVLSLVQLLRQSQHEQIRALCTVLLRRVVGKRDDSLWPSISIQAQSTVKTQLLEALEVEQSSHMRNKLVDTISELAADLIEKGQWPELLPFMFKCVKSENEFHREAALQLFADLAADLADQLKPHLAVLKDVLVNALNWDPSIKVRLAGLTATVNFLQIIDDPQERAAFQQLLPLMLGTISQALNGNQEEEARGALELFVEMAELDPGCLRPHLTTIVQAMFTIATANTLEDSTKNLGLEFLITLCESKAPMVRKVPKFVDTIVPIILGMMLQLEDDDSWNSGHDEDEVDITNPDIGEESLDRLAIALGGKSLVPVLFGLIPALFSNADWKHRHTALMSISIVGEGCHEYLLPNLTEIIKSVIPFFGDAHPRVRWAACNTVGQMATDFGPEFQRLFHSQVLPSLIAVMDDAQNPRVQSHAAAAVINFCEHATPEILTPYLDSLLSKLFTLLQQGKIIAQEQVVTAIAAVADAVKTGFIKYYDVFMPLMKHILSNHSKEYRMLRGKTMECVSLVANAVGKEKFLQDAKEVMDLMLQSGQLEADDPQISFLLQSWARLCRCLGHDFVPYLGLVMPQLLKSAKLSPDVTITDADSPQDADGWEFIPLGDKRIGINTSALEEKSTACNMLYCYASELKEAFFPYVDEVTKLLVPLMRFYYHDGVRSAAITTMPPLLTSALHYLQKNAATGADRTFVRNLFHFMLPTLLEEIKEELDMEVLALAIEALSECIEIAGDGCLSAEQMHAIVEATSKLIAEIKERREDRRKRKSEEGHDDEEEERIEDEAERDNAVIANIADTLGHIFKHMKETFLPHFQAMLPLILELLAPNQQAVDRQAALCIFDDLVEFTGQSSIPYLQHFLQAAVQYVADPDPAVRQAAVYGMGVYAQVGGAHIAPAIPEILSRLSQVISHPESRSEENVNPTENAIAAVGKICLYQSSAVDISKVLPVWLSWLPVSEDKVESLVTYGQLCTFVESNNPHIFGASYANLPKVLSVFADVLGTDLINEELGHRIVNILKQIRSGLPQDVLQHSWGALKPEQQQKLQQAISA